MNEEDLKEWLRGLEAKDITMKTDGVTFISDEIQLWSHRKEHTHIVGIHKFVERMEKAYFSGWESIGTLTAHGRGLNFMKQEMQRIVKELEERGY